MFNFIKSPKISIVKKAIWLIITLPQWRLSRRGDGGYIPPTNWSGGDTYAFIPPPHKLSFFNIISR